MGIKCQSDLRGKLMSKKLVAYFSASGQTGRLAKTLSEAIGANLFEIVPEQKYTDEDLNWQNSSSRSSVEMKDRSARPAISSKVANMPEYDVVFVGFPIWWYREPSIIDTFIESYDFAGKTIVPFATSGGSGMGDSSANIQALAPRAKVAEGRRFASSANAKEMKSWLEKLL